MFCFVFCFLNERLNRVKPETKCIKLSCLDIIFSFVNDLFVVTTAVIVIIVVIAIVIVVLTVVVVVVVVAAAVGVGGAAFSFGVSAVPNLGRLPMCSAEFRRRFLLRAYPVRTALRQHGL